MAGGAKAPLAKLLRHARHTLAMSQSAFGPALGWSQRTALRWETGRSAPPTSSLCKLAALLAPVDLELAAEVAAAAGQTLESLGLATKVETPAPRTTPADLTDAVVCSVADASELPSRAVRQLLAGAFARARALGLTVEQVDDALRAQLATKATRGKGQGQASAPLRVRVAHVPDDEGEAAQALERGRRRHGSR
jgi:DNA-binding XRE family transcriptional regulator